MSLMFCWWNVVAPRLDLDPNNRSLLLERGIGMLVLDPNYYASLRVLLWGYAVLGVMH